MRTSRSYAIERGGPSRVAVSWEGSFKSVRVEVDGAELASTDGKTFTMPDGSKLTARMRGMLGVEVLRDGAPLPGSDLDPRSLLRNAAVLLAVLGAINGAWDGVRFERGLGMTRSLAIDGALFVCAVATWLGVRWALALGIVAFAARFGLEEQHATATTLSTFTVIFGLVATWLLATHFFAARPSRRH